MIRERIGWEIGDRVTRELYIDDGTWAEKGDECLPNSPLRHGKVVAVRSRSDGTMVYHVRWDDGTEGQSYLWHGIDAEKQELNDREEYEAAQENRAHTETEWMNKIEALYECGMTDEEVVGALGFNGNGYRKILALVAVAKERGESALLDRE